MAYLNANIPATYAQVRREYLYDLSGHVGEVEDCLIFGMASITGRAILFHAIMENGAIFYRFRFLPLSKEALMSKKFLGCDLTSWSFGIVLVTILAITTFDILLANQENILVKIKNGITVNIFLRLTGLTQRVI
jgi:hypothetical protein